MRIIKRFGIFLKMNIKTYMRLRRTMNNSDLATFSKTSDSGAPSKSFKANLCMREPLSEDGGCNKEAEQPSSISPFPYNKKL